MLSFDFYGWLDSYFGCEVFTGFDVKIRHWIAVEGGCSLYVPVWVAALSLPSPISTSPFNSTPSFLFPQSSVTSHPPAECSRCSK